MKYLILALSIFIASPCFADMYAVQKPNEPVVIVTYREGSSDSFEDVLDEMGLTGYPITKVSMSDIPNDRLFREAWRVNNIPIGRKIKEDPVKKAEIVAKKQDMENKKAAVKTKLKLSNEELKHLKEALRDV